VENSDGELEFREGMDEREEHHYEVEAHGTAEAGNFFRGDREVGGHGEHCFKAGEGGDEEAIGAGR